ncbi:putative transcriptional regulator [Paenibacillus sp. DS2015]|uniref:TrmB family transcriptional regulator n=1 Tax=Paenibacillus sp. DS2015 TaxID=3373917 RepID=UPI003D25F0CC
MEQLLHHLRTLGFIEMEAKIMVELAGSGPSSGYEVAKRMGVSRSNVYATLQRLTQQGFLQCSTGEPIRYNMLKIEELTRLISGQMKESISFIESRMPRAQVANPPFYHVEGEREVLDILVREMEKATKEIVIDVWREEAALLRNELEQAESRGVKLLWSTDGGDATMSRYLSWPSWDHGSTTNGPSVAGRKFSFVMDRHWCMLGMRGEDPSKTVAMITDHPVMTELLLSHFTQEMVLYEVEKDIGSELVERYGPHYEQIYRKYVGVDIENED